jgi:diketogulonate reductase-like aldo/keto reductase
VSTFKARGCTRTQAILAWNLYRKVVVIPKTIQAVHQKENIVTVAQCKMTDEDTAKLDSIKEQIQFYINACD